MTSGVVANRLTVGYSNGLQVLHDFDFEAEGGSVTCVVGPSGAGKSTLLYALAGVLPSGGSISLLGQPLSSRARSRAKVRRERCGFVFQRGELLGELTVLENVALPLRLLGKRPSVAHTMAAAALDRLGVGQIADRDPTEISGGQAQRASVARALVHSPPVVFADEPTGSLDAASRSTVIAALVAAASEGACVIVATHDDEVLASAAKVVSIPPAAESDTPS